MPRETSSALQKIEKEIQRLQKQAKTLQAKRRGPVLTSILRSMREYDITPEDIAAAFNKKTVTKTPRKQATPAKRVVPAKYRNPETGDTWTGRGKPPRWVTTAEAEGKSRADFLIQQ
ncbi:H-NS family nucleoid-associated regulatory protein [Allopusillimonas ginsengisoli]|uniref:H-NS histone family protein n=1 Tax=Allopusillimonas ginsengisoli TaxID=453575 RepID=UPI001021BB74|nr:H-NS histone family protein [Allopusillimonas ginsengisoli]TEA78109.1 H-NS histone family protein [Allopusillimonas ginsengisoli]